MDGMTSSTPASPPAVGLAGELAGVAAYLERHGDLPTTAGTVRRIARQVAALEAAVAAPAAVVRVFRDGDMWCAMVGSNLQEGRAGFGVSPMAALDELAVYLAGSPWPEGPIDG